MFSQVSLSTQPMVIQEIWYISMEVKTVASVFISLLARIILAKPEKV